MSPMRAAIYIEGEKAKFSTGENIKFIYIYMKAQELPSISTIVIIWRDKLVH